MVRTLRAVQAARPDVVHVFKPIGYGWAACWWARWKGLRLCVDSDDWEGHGGWADRGTRPAWQKRLITWQEKSTLRAAAQVTVASRKLEELAVEIGVPAERIRRVGNFSTLPTVPPRPRACEAIMYTRFVEFAPSLLVEVWAAVHRSVPEATLRVIGAGPQGEESKLRIELQARGLEASARLEGLLSPENVSSALSRARVGLFPCEDTLLNAAKCPVRLADMVAAGLPVVAHDVGDASVYVEEGRGGFLLRPGVVSEFVERAVQLLMDSELADRMGSAAREHYLASVGPESAGATLVSMYRNMLRKSAAATMETPHE
jgi:glycosyltransferase involved in cell wall biosynthesis